MQGRRASLSDLTSIEDIDMLSVRQLKEILARNFVNYKGCCEKWELMERVTRLYRERDLQHLGKVEESSVLQAASTVSRRQQVKGNSFPICSLPMRESDQEEDNIMLLNYICYCSCLLT